MRRNRPSWVWTAAAWVGLWMVCGGGPAWAADGGVRTWTDSTGKFSLEAKFVALENGRVTLERTGGQQLVIDLKKLSAADQKFVEQAMSANPFQPKVNNPFKAVPTGGAAAPTASASRKVDLSQAQLIALVAPPEGWNVQVPEAPKVFDQRPRAVGLPDKDNFFEDVKGLAINPVAKRAAVSFVLGEPRPTGTTRIVLCDLATGRCTKPASVSGQMSPLAVHDDGLQILMRRDEFGFGKLDRLEVWTLRGGNVVKNLIWTPYENAKGGNRDVMWAEFLDKERLATASRAGTVVVWSYPDLKPLYTFETLNGAVPALSPDRKLIAYCTGGQVGLFDVDKREVVAQQATGENLHFPCLAFSPSGKRLGCVAFDKVLMWDVATGKLEREFKCPGIVINGKIDYPAEDFMLVGDNYLIDLPNQLKLWKYDGYKRARTVGGTTFFTVVTRDQRALVNVPLPHSEARDLLKKALEQPELFVLRPGATVKLNLSDISDPAARERVRKGLTQRLAAIKCQAGDSGAIELVATVEGPKQREVRFRHAGTFQMQEYRSVLKFVHQGQPVWETSSTNVPGFMIRLEEGENVASYLRKREKPNYGFFGAVELPRFLQKPAKGQDPSHGRTLGQSTLTVTGIR